MPTLQGMDEREQAWFALHDALHDALPPGWRLGQPTQHPTDGWAITAMSPRPGGRLARSEFVVTGRGPKELDAVRGLTKMLH